MEYIKNFDSTLEQRMSPFKKTFYLKGVLNLLIVLYDGLLAPQLPRQVLLLFENQYFKLFVFSIILWTAQFSPSTSILLSVAFMVSMNAVNKKPLWEFLENVAAPAAQDAVPAVMISAPAPASSIVSAPAPAPPSKPMESVVQNNIPVSPIQSIEAVKVLAQAAASKEASAPAAVANIANIIAANVTTETGATALKQLAEQAIVPAPGAPQKVEEAVVKVIQSIPPPAAPPVAAPIVQVAQKVAVSEPAPAPASAGCYPIRRYDMSKVESSRVSDNSSNGVFEEPQAWSA